MASQGSKKKQITEVNLSIKDADIAQNFNDYFLSGVDSNSKIKLVDTALIALSECPDIGDILDLDGDEITIVEREIDISGDVPEHFKVAQWAVSKMYTDHVKSGSAGIVRVPIGGGNTVQVYNLAGMSDMETSDIVLTHDMEAAGVAIYSAYAASFAKKYSKLMLTPKSRVLITDVNLAMLGVHANMLPMKESYTSDELARVCNALNYATLSRPGRMRKYRDFNSNICGAVAMVTAFYRGKGLANIDNAMMRNIVKQKLNSFCKMGNFERPTFLKIANFMAAKSAGVSDKDLDKFLESIGQTYVDLPLTPTTLVISDYVNQIENNAK